MFNNQKGIAPPQQPPQAGPQNIPPVDKFQVRLGNGEWETIEAHTLNIDNGTVVFVRAGYLTEDFSLQRIMPVRVYAPGEWSQVKCDWKGYAKSPLSIR